MNCLLRIIVICWVAATAARSEAYTMYAFTWDPVDSAHTSLIATYKLQNHWLTHFVTDDMKEWCDKQPAGKRAMRPWIFDRQFLAEHPGNTVQASLGNTVYFIDSTGDSAAYRGLWWNAGIDSVSSLLDSFMAKYEAAGGELDYMIVDMEKGLSNWHLNNNAASWYENDRAGYYEVLASDPRFAPLYSALGDCDLCDHVGNWMATDSCYLQWNGLMLEQVAGYMNQGLFDPVWKHFPQVKGSEWLHRYYSSDYPVIEKNGHKISKMAPGAHVGTHQSTVSYGGLLAVSDNPALAPIPGTPYPRTGINALKFDLNHQRAAQLSRPDVPMSVWVAPRNWEGDGGYKETPYKDSDWYQEMIFHTLLGLDTAGFIMYWNPLIFTTPASDSIVDACLKTMDDIIGSGVREPLIDSLIGWYDDCVITGMRTDSMTVWRFTPDMDSVADINDLIINEEPAELSYKGRSITFPKGKIYWAEQPVSAYGLWIIETPEDSAVGMMMPHTVGRKHNEEQRQYFRLSGEKLLTGQQPEPGVYLKLQNNILIKEVIFD